MAFSDRAWDIVKTVYLLSPISQEILINLVALIRKERKEKVQEEFIVLKHAGVFRIGEENYPFSGEKITSIYLTRSTIKQIEKEEQLSKGYISTVMDKAVRLILSKKLDEKEKGWLLILLMSEREKFTQRQLVDLRKFLETFIVEKQRQVHPVYFWAAPKIIDKKKILSTFIDKIFSTEIQQTHEGYGNMLLEYSEIASALGDNNTANKCIKKAIESYNTALSNAKDSVEKGNIKIKIGNALERLNRKDKSKSACQKGINLLYNGLKAGEIKKREKEIKELIRDEIKVWMQIGEILREKLKEKEKARQIYHECIDEVLYTLSRVKPDEERAKILETIGSIKLKKLEDYSGAIETYKEGLKYQDSWELWKYIAFTYETWAKDKEKNEEEATAEWREAEKHHLEAIKRIEESELKGGAWEHVGDIRKDKMADNKGAQEAYQNAIRYLKESLDEAETDEERAKIVDKIARIKEKLEELK